MDELTDRQQAILDFIRTQLAEHGRPPSQSEIAGAFGVPLRAAQKHLMALQQKGRLRLQAHTARGIRLLDDHDHPGDAGWRLPILGRVAAGLPIDALADHSGDVLLDHRLFSPKPDYLLRVVGESMRDDGILDGDLLAVARRSHAENGQTVVARIDGELTVKRLRLEPQRILLLPRNPAFAPIEVPEQAEFAIEGLFCGLIRQA